MAAAKTTAAKKAAKTTAKNQATAPIAKKVGAKKASVTKTGATAAPDALVGKKFPAFQLTDGDGKKWSLAKLKGKPFVVYFYPKDNTPGCTQEACDFRDTQGEFEALGVTVLGVSPDGEASHAGFARKHSLSFPLLSDPDKELSSALGVYALKKNYGREFMGIVRSTFLVGASGVILAAWRGVKVAGHAAKVLARAQEMNS